MGKKKLAIFFFVFLEVLFNRCQSLGLQFENTFLELSKLKLFDLNGDLVSLDPVTNKFVLFLYFNPLRVRDKGIMAYAEVLNRKYKYHGLKILGICHGNESDCKEFHSKGNFSFSFISDKQSQLNHILDPSFCCGATLLIERSGLVKFRSSLLSNQENLRQLIEKEITGKIEYNLPLPLPLSIDEIKRRLFALSFLDIASGQVKNIKELITSDYTLMNFYFIFCPACKEARRNTTLKTINETIINYKIKANILLLFPSFYNEKDIKEMPINLDLPFPKLIYFGDFFSDEEKYITNPNKKIDPLIFLLNREMNVIFIESPGESESAIKDEILQLIQKR